MCMEFVEEVTITAPVKLYECFAGKPVEKMPVLLRNHTPITLNQVFEKRVDGSDDSEVFRNRYITTGDQFIRDPKGDGMKYVRADHPLAVELNTSMKFTNQLKNWSLPVSKDQYEALVADEVHTFSPSVVKALRNGAYSLPNERQAFFEFALSGNSDLFKENLALQEAKGRTLDDSLGVYPSEYAGMRLVWVGSVGDEYSYADGNYDLDYIFGRLVGVAPEVHSEVPESTQKNSDLQIVTPSLEQTLAIVNNPDYNRVDMVEAISQLYK